MPVVANTTVLTAQFNWEQEKSQTSPFTSTSQKGSFTSKPTVNTTTFNHVYLATGTLAAAADTTLDFYSSTNLAGEAVTATKLLGIVIKLTATVTGGQFKMEDGAANPLAFAWGVGDSITLTVGTAGATVVLMAGTTHTVSATVRNVKISNPGTQTVTYVVGAIIGT